MHIAKQHIMIKGNKEGLQFWIDAECAYQDILDELQQKLKGSYAQFLQGPLTHVFLHFGTRYLSADQKNEISAMINGAGNLLVKQIHSDVITLEESMELLRSKQMHIETGMIRSGQVLESEQDILILGDVNPGGHIISHGSIYIMGALKGVAHAGYRGKRDKIIAASWMEPTQLRIADVILELGQDRDTKKQMEFAYLQGDRMEINPIQALKKLLPV